MSSFLAQGFPFQQAWQPSHSLRVRSPRKTVSACEPAVEALSNNLETRIWVLPFFRGLPTTASILGGRGGVNVFYQAFPDEGVSILK